jgi:hypothetical protein
MSLLKTAGKSGKRSFTIVSVARSSGAKKGKSNEGGRYISSTPAGAARKAFTRACRNSKISGVCTFIVTLRETTAGSSKKTYKYKLQRKLKKKPVEINGRVFKYDTTAKSMN